MTDWLKDHAAEQSRQRGVDGKSTHKSLGQGMLDDLTPGYNKDIEDARIRSHQEGLNTRAIIGAMKQNSASDSGYSEGYYPGTGHVHWVVKIFLTLIVILLATAVFGILALVSGPPFHPDPQNPDRKTSENQTQQLKHDPDTLKPQTDSTAPAASDVPKITEPSMITELHIPPAEVNPPEPRILNFRIDGVFRSLPAFARNRYSRPDPTMVMTIQNLVLGESSTDLELMFESANPGTEGWILTAGPARYYREADLAESYLLDEQDRAYPLIQDSAAQGGNPFYGVGTAYTYHEGVFAHYVNPYQKFFTRLSFAALPQSIERLTFYHRQFGPIRINLKREGT